MTTSRFPAGHLLVAVAIALTGAACSSSGGTPQGEAGQGGEGTAAGGSGGTTGSGGHIGSGGQVGSGGSAQTGGSSGAGGTLGSGGATGSGGAIGSGGLAGTAGTTGSGGSTGTGGVGGHAGAGGAGSGGAGGSGTGATGGHAGAGGAGTGGAAGAGTSTGGTGAYNPCPSSGTACKILPLGDSITYGVNDEGDAGYRGPLFATAVAAGQKITFTGSLSDGPTTVSGQPFPMQNEGHSGWGISEVTPYSGGNAGIATVIPTPAFSGTSGGTPDIILLHIGTNDQGSFPATQMISDLQGLLNKIITNAPNALIVVAQIIPLGYGTNSVIMAYNQAIPGVVQSLAAAGKHIEVMDMYTGFNTSTMLGSDSIHPNAAGYQFMASHWYSVIGSLLPK
jgi:hypothetical protein